MTPNTKTLIGAILAAVLAVAVYYGVISQQSATQIQTQADQTLGTSPASQQAGGPNAPAGAPTNPPSQATAPVPQH